MPDDTPLYEIIFDIEMNLCDRFPSMTPLALRREKAREVFLLISRFNRYSQRKKSKPKNVIRKPAGDNWF